MSVNAFLRTTLRLKVMYSLCIDQKLHLGGIVRKSFFSIIKSFSSNWKKPLMEKTVKSAANDIFKKSYLTLLGLVFRNQWLASN